MTNRGNWGRETGRLLKEIDVPDLNDQLDAVRDYLRELTSSFSKIANRQWRSTRGPRPRHGARDRGNHEGQSRSFAGRGLGNRGADGVSDPSEHRLNCGRWVHGNMDHA